MMKHLPDHGLPLVQLKEQRRDLVVALQNRNGPVSSWELMQIAAVQHAPAVHRGAARPAVGRARHPRLDRGRRQASVRQVRAGAGPGRGALSGEDGAEPGRRILRVLMLSGS